MNRRFRTSQADAQDGQVLVLFALMVIVLVGFLGLAIDAGYLMTQRRHAQNAADAAALAAAVAYLNGDSANGAQADGESYGMINGLTASEISVVVTGNRQNGVATAIATKDVTKFFIGALYSGDWKVSATAKAAIKDDMPVDASLLALDLNDYPIDVTGNINVRIVEGGAISNAGFKCTGNGKFIAESTANAHSGIKETGNCDIIGQKGENPNAPVVSDPLASVPPPPTPGVPATGGMSSASCSPSNSANGNGDALTCPEGKYISNIRVNGNNQSVEFGSSSGINSFFFNGSNVRLTGNNPNITFWPGSYYFKNGELDMTGNNPRIEFKPGQYQFYFVNSAMKFTGNNPTLGYDKYAAPEAMHFYFENSDFTATGNSRDLTIPPGVYHFNGGDMKFTGNSKVYGENVFFYFENGGSFNSTGNSKYEFSASPNALYSGMYPEMLFYSSRSNAETFTMVGNSNSLLTGLIYLPAAHLDLKGNTSGVWADGQVIVDSIDLTGNANLEIRHRSLVDIHIPAVYLTE